MNKMELIAAVAEAADGMILKLRHLMGDKWEPLKNGVKSKKGQGVPDSRKADEVRLYALRGGLTTKMVRTAHFRSHEVFRGDQML